MREQRIGSREEREEAERGDAEEAEERRETGERGDEREEREEINVVRWVPYFFFFLHTAGAGGNLASTCKVMSVRCNPQNAQMGAGAFGSALRCRRCARRRRGSSRCRY